MGLIARAIEAAGIPTLSMTSALSITRSAGAPRAAFLDFPLGHTTGKPHDAALQRRILVDALSTFETIARPGEIVTLEHAWADDDAWKDDVMRPRSEAAEASDPDGFEDDRAPRRDTPQYQTEEDAALAARSLAADGCPTCVFLD